MDRLESLKSLSKMTSEESIMSRDALKNSDNSFKKKYNDIIFNSKESAAYHFLAAENLLASIEDKSFSISAISDSISLENDLRKTLALDFASKGLEGAFVFNSFDKLFSFESTPSKFKRAKAVIASALKEAFKKLRLVLANVISAIRKFIAKTTAANYMTLIEKRNSIEKAMKTDGARNEKIKILAYSSSSPFAVSADFFNKGMDTWKVAIGIVKSELDKDLDSASKGAPLSDTVTKYNGLMTRILGKMFTSKAAISWMNGKSNVVKSIIYGRAQPKALEVSLANVYKGIPLTVLSRNFVDKTYAVCNEVNGLIGTCTKAITVLEKGVSKSINDKKARENFRKTLNGVKQVIGKLGPLTKDLFVEIIRIRSVLARACSASLKYSKDQNNPIQAGVQKVKNIVKKKKK